MLCVVTLAVYSDNDNHAIIIRMSDGQTNPFMYVTAINITDWQTSFFPKQSRYM